MTARFNRGQRVAAIKRFVVLSVVAGLGTAVLVGLVAIVGALYSNWALLGILGIVW